MRTGYAGMQTGKIISPGMYQQKIMQMISRMDRYTIAQLQQMRESEDYVNCQDRYLTRHLKRLIIVYFEIIDYFCKQYFEE